MSELKPYFETELGKLYHGDCRQILKEFPGNYFDTVVTDPPYELGFMGRKWDSSGIAFQVEVWNEVLRVSKPGAMILAFGGTRTFHRLACAIEDAGWEIRDCMMWLYGSGFPKSYDISKGIDKLKAAPRKTIKIPANKVRNPKSIKSGHGIKGGDRPWMQRAIEAGYHEKDNNNPITPEAKLWNGWGTALKPAWEPIIVAMKPLEGTFTQNALKWGVGGLNIDGCRIPFRNEEDYNSAIFGKQTDIRGNKYCINRPSDGHVYAENVEPNSLGRWPTNVILDEKAAKMLDEQSGLSVSSGGKGNKAKGMFLGEHVVSGQNAGGLGDKGGASRFFYVAKASRFERGEFNDHPTVKPLKLIKYLCKLTMTPTKGIVLDPFIGSGTTALACEQLGRKWIGIDSDLRSCEIAKRRIKIETQQLKLFRRL